MQKTNNLQDIFLTKARKENVPVTLFLVNGFQLRGVITGFDCFVVVLDSEGRQQVIYKHAISTIAPMRPLPMGSASSHARAGQRYQSWRIRVSLLPYAGVLL